MKSAGAVKHKLNQVRFRHMKKRIEAELRRAPGNCVYNAVVPPPVLPVPGGEVDGVPLGVPVPVSEPNAVGFGLCLLGADDPSTWKPTFCDERIDLGQRARACPKFCPRRTKDQVKEEFRRELEGMSLAEVAYRYPDMAALTWVLDAEDIPSVADDVEEPAEDEDASPSAVATAPVSPEPTNGAGWDEPVALVPSAPKRGPWWARWILERLS